MAQQTAVEWLAKELEDYGDPASCKITWKDLDSLVERAKQMEKEQIIDAYDAGLFDGTMDDVNDRIYKQYYNETYKK